MKRRQLWLGDWQRGMGYNLAMDLAIACAVGGFKGAFGHGVLAAFEEAGLRAAAYGGASSSVPIAGCAATGRVQAAGLDYWQQGLAYLQQPGVGMSQMVQAGIDYLAPFICEGLFRPDSPRFFVAANAVAETVAAEVQSLNSRRLGRKLLLDIRANNREWVDSNLTLHLFSQNDPHFPLTAQNFSQVAYASSRMLHAWDVPAWVNGRAYVDAFYTCACPAIPLAEQGYQQILAIFNEPTPYRDFFMRETIPTSWKNSQIWLLRPEQDPTVWGVNYTHATPEGLNALYQQGVESGRAFLSQKM